MSVAKEILDRLPPRPTRQVSVVCATTSPFRVYLDGDQSVMVPARIKAGSTFTPGDSGLADWCPPSLPICFRTT